MNGRARPSDRRSGLRRKTRFLSSAGRMAGISNDTENKELDRLPEVEYLRAMNDEQIKTALGWYLTRVNNGRGRLSAEANTLLKRGFLSLTWTSAVTWSLAITAQGRDFLNK